MLTEHLEQELADILERHIVFSALGQDMLRQLVARFEMVSYAMGDSIVNEGEPGHSAFLVYSGKVRVVRRGPTGKPVTLATLGKGQLFGEHAIATDEERTASVRAADDTVLFRIERADFQRLLDEHPELRSYVERLIGQRALGRFLQLGTALGAVPAAQIITVLDQFEDCFFRKGETIFRQGEDGDRLYVIQSGEAKVVRSADGQETVLAYLVDGDYFGERALILDEPRYASVVATAETRCAQLSRDSFQRLVEAAPQLHKQLVDRIGQYHTDEAMARQFGAKPQPHLPPEQLVYESPDERAETIGQRPISGLARRILHWWKLYPLVLQRDETECGAASLSMIAGWHGIPLSLERLRDLAHVGYQGASMFSLTAAAERIGLRWRALETDYAHLQKLPLPGIAHWKGYHYLVVYEADERGVLLGDPAAGRRKLPREQFEAGWGGKLVTFEPTPDFKKNSPEASGWRCLLSYLREHGTLARRTLLSSVIIAVLGALILVAVQVLVDRIHGADTGPLAWWSAVVAVLVGLLGGVAWLRTRWMSALVERTAQRIHQDWFERVLRFPRRYFESRRIGHLLTRLPSSPTTIERTILRLLQQVRELPLCAAAVVLCVYYSPPLAAVMTVALSFAILIVALSNRFRERYRLWCGIGEVDRRSQLVEAVEAVETLKEFPADRPQTEAAAVAVSAASSDRTGGRVTRAIGQGTLALALLVVVLTGSLQLRREELTLGGLCVVLFSFGLLAQSIPRWQRDYGELESLGALLESLAEIREVPLESSADTPLTRTKIRGFLEISDVCFRYHPDSAEVLSHLNLTLAPGRFALIVGRSGAGKTTLGQLLRRTHSPTRGSIQLDGHELERIDGDWLHRHVSVIDHQPRILRDSIRRNIAMANQAAGIDEVIAAAKLAGVHDFVMSLSLGYDTLVGAGGLPLSSSQQLGVGLARGFLKAPRLLVLDGVISSLDDEAAQHLSQSLRWTGRERITILLERRPLPVAADDLVVVLDNGRLVEQGRHHELLANRGLYSFLTSQQLKS